MEICFVTSRFPLPLTKGDKARGYHQIRELSKRHNVTLVSGADEDVPAPDRIEMDRWCRHVEVVRIDKMRSIARTAWGLLSSHLPLQVLYFQAPELRDRLRTVLRSRSFDVVHASLIRTLPHVWSINSPPVVADLMDAFSLSVLRRKELAFSLLQPIYEIEYRRLAAYERKACKRFVRLAVTSPIDRGVLESDRVAVVAQGVDLHAFAYRPGGRDGSVVIMTGNLGYEPNVDAAVWFARQIWPRILAERPDAHFRIVGARPVRAVRALQALPGVEVVGPVPDVALELHRATLGVCPMRSGAGIQSKLLEALATGTPSVSTTLGNQGVGATPDRDLLIADEPHAFASQAVRLLDDNALKQELARNGRRHVEDRFSWDYHGRMLEELYRAAGATG